MTYNTIDNDVTMAGGAEGALLANRYRIVKQLGQGGMGSVWLAEDTQLDNKPFAIKMLPSVLVSNARAYRQLKDEALVAMKLTHPNIVTLRAFEENDGNPFLVMDYIEGQTLDNCLERWGNLSAEEAAALLTPIAEALDYAHSQGVVHRDVKPGNVMVRSDGVPFILDFGIAREVQESMTHITGRQSSGTLLYMSPEQLNGDAPRPAQDVYSFAAMAYECIKGAPPFNHGNVEYQLMNKEPEPLPKDGAAQEPIIAGIMAGLSKNPEARPKSCQAVLRCSFAKDPAQRFATCIESIDAAESLTPSAQPRFKKFINGKKHILTLGFIGLLGAAAIMWCIARYKVKVATNNFLDAQFYGKWEVAVPLMDKVDISDARVQDAIGLMYAFGLGVRKDCFEAVRWYREAAEQGNPSAQSHLGRCYRSGEGVVQSYAEAMKWYIKAAEQGSELAQNDIGEFYEAGLGVLKNDAEAVKWYRMAAESGFGLAQLNLGRMYLEGKGVSEDYAEAFKWYRKAVDKIGTPEALRELGFMYLNGWGCAKDGRKAEELLSKAADYGDDVAQYYLGVMYDEGLGVSSNEYIAVKWYEKAALQGHSRAQYCLGVLYEKGRGVHKNEFIAADWYRKSAEQGDDDAKTALRRIDQR